MFASHMGRERTGPVLDRKGCPLGWYKSPAGHKGFLVIRHCPGGRIERTISDYGRGQNDLDHPEKLIYLTSHSLPQLEQSKT